MDTKVTRWTHIGLLVSLLSVTCLVSSALLPGCRSRRHTKREPVPLGPSELLAPKSQELGSPALWHPSEPPGPLTEPFCFQWPLESLNLTSPYGHRMHPVVHRVLFHRGLDLAARRGTPVLATAPGLVEFAGRAPLTGNTVVVAHPGDIQSLYAHLDEILVYPGEVVAQGAAVGLVGSTGRSTGPHLHFQLNHKGHSMDPEELLGRSLDSIPELEPTGPAAQGPGHRLPGPSQGGNESP